MGTIRGTVVAGGPVDLEPGSVVVVRLEDVSIADAVAPVVGEQVIEGAETLPLDFAIDFERELDPGRLYNVRARVELDGRLLFNSDRSHPTDDALVEVTLSRIPTPKRLDVEPFLGRWTGTWKTWMEPDVLHDESAIAMTIAPLLGGKDMFQSYEATIASDAVEGVALIGPSQEGVTITWVDTWHTNGLVLTSHGDLDDAGFTVSTIFKADGDDWTWTTQFALERQELVIRHWNEGPGLPRYLGVEARLRHT